MEIKINYPITHKFKIERTRKSLETRTRTLREELSKEGKRRAKKGKPIKTFHLLQDFVVEDFDKTTKGEFWHVGS